MAKRLSGLGTPSVTDVRHLGTEFRVVALVAAGAVVAFGCNQTTNAVKEKGQEADRAAEAASRDAREKAHEIQRDVADAAANAKTEVEKAAQDAKAEVESAARDAKRELGAAKEDVKRAAETVDKKVAEEIRDH